MYIYMCVFISMFSSLFWANYFWVYCSLDYKIIKFAFLIFFLVGFAMYELKVVCMYVCFGGIDGFGL